MILTFNGVSILLIATSVLSTCRISSTLLEPQAMGRGSLLSDFEKGQILAKKKQGLSNRRIARKERIESQIWVDLTQLWISSRILKNMEPEEVLDVLRSFPTETSAVF
ncbi:hypothetical protein V3C99_008221 [Haemonchus contortus]|uniref:RxLR effector candidate protein n=1 Tax=Haemonchus contortus TaxID=6289 RepID=A0A7I4YNM0_HAECO